MLSLFSHLWYKSSLFFLVLADAELIIVLVGDTSSIETGTKNILTDKDECTGFSPKLYDLCGQHISVINLLGLQHLRAKALNLRINIFLLLIPYGLHVSHYRSGLRWLEKTFGRESLSYVLTVVTHNSGEKFEDALKDLRAHDGFVEKRYHTCTRSMSGAEEIAELLVKIQTMVSENEPSSFAGLICDENTEQKKDLEPECLEHNLESPLFKEKQTGKT